MISAASGLLRLLAGEAAPRTDTATKGPAGLADHPDFSSLLEMARAGEIHSGREITVASRANVKLSEDQLQRLAAAADLAEAQGAMRALVLIDGQALRLDVSMREVIEAVDLAKAGVMTNIDAVVSVPASASAASDGAAILPPPGDGRAWSNASLLSALSQRDEQNHDQEEAR